MQTALNPILLAASRLPLPLWLAVAGFGLMFFAALLLWAQFGTAVFVDGAAVVWGCF